MKILVNMSILGITVMSSICIMLHYMLFGDHQNCPVCAHTTFPKPVMNHCEPFTVGDFPKRKPCQNSFVTKRQPYSHG